MLECQLGWWQERKELKLSGYDADNERPKVEEEAIALTYIGNNFMIRHTETGKPKIERSEHVDYLFHRQFALIWMILRIRGGIGT